MSFLTPLAFALGILLPIIIAMYLLKLRRTELIVSSTYLWERMVKDVEANAPWQRLRRNLLLLLQILFLLVLIIALARPFSWTEGSNSQSIILIFDTSASMAATDLDPNRLESAKERARLLISNLPQDARCTIIEAGEKTQVLVSSSHDKRSLYQALENINSQPGSSELTKALELASAIAARQLDTEIWIYSDGRVNLPEQLAIQDQINYIALGESDNNQAISMIEIEPGINQDTLTAFIQVSNYSAEPALRRLTIKTDNKLVDAQDLEIPAFGHISVISEIIPKGTIILEATLGGNDDLPLDDKAWTIQEVSQNQNIILISEGNRFIETALDSIPGINYSVQNREYLNSETKEEISLVIFDNITQEFPNLQSPNLLYVGPISNTNTFSITGIIENPVPTPISENDPLLKYVDLKQVNILDAISIPLPGWARSVVVDENSGEPLLFVGEINGDRIAVLTFDLRRSDFPLQASYPILFANLIDWLLPGRLGDIPTQVTPGQVLTFTPPPGITDLTITRPDGLSTDLEIHAGQARYLDTSQLGIYQVNWGENQSLLFSVNLFSPQESNIQPVENLTLLERNISKQDEIHQQTRREWWQPIAIIALTILVFEWLVYNRSTLAKAWDQITRRADQRA